MMKPFVLATLLLFEVLRPPAFSQPALSPQEWGPAVGGLRIGLTIERGDLSMGDTGFLIAFKNTRANDFVLNLGSMFANGMLQLPTEVRLLVTDSEGTTRELTFFVGPIDSRQHPFTVPLRAGSTYTVRTSLRDYFVPTLDGSNVRLPAGRDRIVARFEGHRTQSGDSTIRDVDLLTFWQGTIESNAVELEVPEDPGSQRRGPPSIAGCIVDRGGYGLPGVSLVANGSGLERTAKSTATGCYEFRDLPPGQYRMTAALSGFATVTREHLAVVSGVVTRFDFTMEISYVVDVSDLHPIAETNRGAAVERMMEEDRPHTYTFYRPRRSAGYVAIVQGRARAAADSTSSLGSAWCEVVRRRAHLVLRGSLRSKSFK